MTSEETRFFELVDGYSRTQHHCFVAEMFLTNTQTEYVLCFRPVGVTKDSSERYACRYLYVEANEAKTMGQTRTLDASIRQKLDTELPAMGPAG